MQRTKWIERKFNFDFPLGMFPNIMERLRGTPARIKEMTSNLHEEQLKFKPENKWSIKEHIGHLIDLEKLNEGRIDDFLAGKQVLRAADMTNALTYQSNHNEQSLGYLIQTFSDARKEFVLRFERLDDQTNTFSALHPRLQVMMRPVDLSYFTAEHDDHHLASIREILNLRKNS